MHIHTYILSNAKEITQHVKHIMDKNKTKTIKENKIS